MNKINTIDDVCCHSIPESYTASKDNYLSSDKSTRKVIFHIRFTKNCSNISGNKFYVVV